MERILEVVAEGIAELFQLGGIRIYCPMLEDGLLVGKDDDLKAKTRCAE